MAKTIVLFAYHFPPIGGPTGERALQLARQLPEHGYEPIVLTGASPPEFWSPHDSSSEERLSLGLRVERVPVPVTGQRRSRAERLLGYPSLVGGVFEEECSRIARELRGTVDAMICVFGRYDLAPAALRLAGELGVPWVADLQDPWALDEMWLYPTGLHRMADRRRMRRTLGDATAVIMNTAEASRRVREAFPELGDERVHVITNGYSAEEFGEASDPERGSAFRIVHTGSLHTEHGLRHRQTAWLRRISMGMPVPGVDLLTRSHLFLLEAIDRLLRKSPALAETIEVHLVGSLTDTDRAIADDSPVVRLHGFKSHSETTQLIRSAHLLFLPMHNLPHGVRAGLVPTKTYEYAASGRPILAAVPPGDARDFLAELGSATIVAPDDVAGMEVAIAEAHARWSRGDEPPHADLRVVSRFEYGEIVGEVACVLDQAVGRD